MRLASDTSVPIILEPTYADDGLITQHISDFMQDQKFLSGIRQGRHGPGRNHPGEIHFRAYIACWAARHALALQGDFAESGVAHGIYSLTICEYLDFETVPKKMLFCSTPSGYSDAYEIS